MKGWHFTRQDYEQAEADGRLLTAQIETSNLCNLACEYCFRAEGDEVKRELDNELTLAETLMIIDQVVDLGAQTVNIIGAGEPFLDKHFETIVGYIAERGATPVVFTNGAAPLGLRFYDHYKLLHKKGGSVVVKLNSFDWDLQDLMAGKKGYAESRDVTLNMIQSFRGASGLRFNQAGNDYGTRMGIDCVVYQKNKGEVLDLFRYARRNNFMPLFKTFIPVGRAVEKRDLEISLDEFLALSVEAERIDREEFGIEQGEFPFMWGTCCTQKGPWAVYVDVQGDIYDCPGQRQHYGNVRDVKLKDAFRELKKRSKNSGLTCPVRLRP